MARSSLFCSMSTKSVKNLRVHSTNQARVCVCVCRKSGTGQARQTHHDRSTTAGCERSR